MLKSKLIDEILDTYNLKGTQKLVAEKPHLIKNRKELEKMLKGDLDRFWAQLLDW